MRRSARQHLRLDWGMRYVRVVSDDLATFFDADEYIRRLPGFVNDLPPGARAFATDPQHYDFTGTRCVKDLRLDQIPTSSQENNDHQLRLRHNCWKHDEDLIIRYHGLRRVEAKIDTMDQSTPATVTLDEILPVAGGCSHEIALWTGSITIIATDLTATWVESGCPDKPCPPNPASG